MMENLQRLNAFCVRIGFIKRIYIFLGIKNEKNKYPKNSEKNGETIIKEDENKENDEHSRDKLAMLDLVCKNCVLSLKDILFGYDLNEILYG